MSWVKLTPPPRRKPAQTVQVNLRIKEALRRRLEREAQKQQVSLNAEMTRRLEGSLADEDRLADWLGGEKNLQLFRVLGPVIAAVEADTGKCWEDDVKTMVRVARSLTAVLHGFTFAKLEPSSLSQEEAIRELAAESSPISTLAGAAAAGPLVKRVLRGDQDDDTNPPSEE